MARGDMRDVVLGDDGDQDTGARRAAAGPSRDGTQDAPAAVSFRDAVLGYRRWLFVLVGALVVVLATVVVPEIRAREQDARLVDVPGVLFPIDPPLEPIWSRSVGLGLEEVTHDVLVAIFRSPDGHEVVGMDPLTGERLWATALPPTLNVADSRCRILRGDLPAPSASVACHLAAPLASGQDRLPYGPGAEQRLLVLEPRTGDVLADRSLGFGYVMIVPWGTDLVLTEVLPDGRLQVTREDPVDGEDRWSLRSDEILPGAGTGAGPRPILPSVEHDVLLVYGPVTRALSPDGKVLGEWVSAAAVPGTEAPHVEVTVLPDGRFVVSDPAERTPGSPYGHVVTSGGRVELALDGPLVPLLVDDGSAADVLLTLPPGGEEIVAVDSRTGVRRWSSATNLGTFPLVLDRRVVTTVGDEVVALDAGSGERLWTALSGEVRSNEALMPDGRVALVPLADDAAGARTLAAVGLSDGRVRWRARAPEGTRGYIEAGGHLFALHGSRITRLS